MNKILGYFYKGLGKFFDLILTFLIVVVNIAVDLFSAIRRFFLYVISMGGCLIIFLLLMKAKNALVLLERIFTILLKM